MNKCEKAKKSTVHKSQSTTKFVSSEEVTDNVADVSSQGSINSNKLVNNSLEQKDQDVTLGNSYNSTLVPTNNTEEDETPKAIEVHACENGKHTEKTLPNGLSNIPPLLPQRSAASHLKNLSKNSFV